MPAPADIQTATLNKFLEGWERKSVKETMALWSNDFTQQLLPLSLGMPESSRAQAEMVYPMLMDSLTNWKVGMFSSSSNQRSIRAIYLHMRSVFQAETKQVIHDTARGTAAVYSITVADTPVPDGEKWTNEYSIFITFSEDGTRVSRLEEMIDTAFFTRVFPGIQQYLAKKGPAAC